MFERNQKWNSYSIIPLQQKGNLFVKGSDGMKVKCLLKMQQNGSSMRGCVEFYDQAKCKDFFPNFNCTNAHTKYEY